MAQPDKAERPTSRGQPSQTHPAPRVVEPKPLKTTNPPDHHDTLAPTGMEQEPTR
jgi:hypothetical protein